MNKPQIYRKRYIPNEIVDISGDELEFRSDALLITKWNPIKTRNDFSKGVSYTFLKEGFKLSKFYDINNSFLYWYCDIIDVDYNHEKDIYVLTDLLLDIKIMPDGRLYVLDSDELSDALENDIITKEQACKALKRMNNILNMIYQDNFPPEFCKNEELIDTKILDEYNNSFIEKCN